MISVGPEKLGGIGMKKEDVVRFESLEAQLKGVYQEMQSLTRKSPSDAVNKFKLELINNILMDLNPFLTNLGYPLKYSQGFKDDLLPFNSDVLLVLSQYLSQMENLRARAFSP